MKQPDYKFIIEIPSINLGSVDISTIKSVELAIDLKPSTPFGEFDPGFPMAPVDKGLCLDSFRLGHDSCGREIIEINTLRAESDSIQADTILFNCRLKLAGSEGTITIPKNMFSNTKELAIRIGFLREVVSCMLTYKLDVYTSVLIRGAKDQSGHLIGINFPSSSIRIGAYQKGNTEKCLKEIDKTRFLVPEVGLALQYFRKAKKLAQVFYSTEYLPEQLLNYCKAISVLLGDNYSTKAFKRRCKDFGISDKERLERIVPTYEKRNSWDVAHRVDLEKREVKRVLAKDIDEAHDVAKDVIQRFIKTN